MLRGPARALTNTDARRAMGNKWEERNDMRAACVLERSLVPSLRFSTARFACALLANHFGRRYTAAYSAATAAEKRHFRTHLAQEENALFRRNTEGDVGV